MGSRLSVEEAFNKHFETWGLLSRPIIMTQDWDEWTTLTKERNPDPAYVGILSHFFPPRRSVMMTSVSVSVDVSTGSWHDINTANFVRAGDAMSVGGGGGPQTVARNSPSQETLEIPNKAVYDHLVGISQWDFANSRYFNVFSLMDIPGARAFGKNLHKKDILTFQVYRDEVVCLPMPEIQVQAGRLHSESGPAVKWPSGKGEYYLRNVRVPDFVVTDPSKITKKIIEKERNQEVRRIMVTRYKMGQEPFGDVAWALDSGAEVIHQDKYGTLYRHTESNQWSTFNQVFVEVTNGTPEPDGTFKKYWLKVEPSLRPMLPNGSFGPSQRLTARNAVASTYGMTGKEYEVSMRT